MSTFSQADGRYTDGSYLTYTAGTWHDEDAAFKARQVARAIQRASLTDSVASVCDIGCGTGKVLSDLARVFPKWRALTGYEISPDALALGRASRTDRIDPRLSFYQGTGLDDTADAEVFDLALVLDVMEHVPDVFGFLRSVRHRARWKLFHIPLDIFCLGVLRRRPVELLRQTGHLHRYDRETALETLRYSGYEIVDHFLTPVAQEAHAPQLGTQATNLIRHALPRATAARLVGGYSLMVLAE